MRKTILLLASVAMAMLLASGVALGAFPGQNGKIVFVSDRDSSSETYNPEIYKMDPDGSSQKRLTDDPARDLEPTWSADGRKIAFASDRTGRYQVWIMNSVGSGLKQVTNNQGQSTSPAFSPNGNKIVFERKNDLYTINVDGSEERRLTRTERHEQDPDWGPGGKRIVFDQFVPAKNELDQSTALCTITPKGTDRSCFLVNTPIGDDLPGPGSPDFSPDSKEVVYLQHATMDTTNIMKAKVGAEEGEYVVDGEDDILGAPVFSPNGRKIAYDGFVDGVARTRIYTVNPDGSGKKAITSGEQGSNFSPDWQAKL